MIRSCPNCRYHPARPGGKLCYHPREDHRGFWDDAAAADECPWFESSAHAKGGEQIPLLDLCSEADER